MSMMVIYLMDKGDDEIEISAEQFGKVGQSLDLGDSILRGLMELDNIHFVNKVKHIASPPYTTSLN